MANHIEGSKDITKDGRKRGSALKEAYIHVSWSVVHVAHKSQGNGKVKTRLVSSQRTGVYLILAPQSLAVVQLLMH